MVSFPLSFRHVSLQKNSSSLITLLNVPGGHAKAGAGYADIFYAVIRSKWSPAPAFAWVSRLTTCSRLRGALTSERDCQDDDNSPDDQLLAHVKAHED